jgi:hypothetical protein
MSSSEIETTFEVDSQSGQTISNIGGSQTINYGERRGGARTGRVLWLLGFALCIAGLALLVPIGVATTHNVLDAAKAGGVQTPYTQYLVSDWPAAVGLLIGGVVMNRFARMLVGR